MATIQRRRRTMINTMVNRLAGAASLPLHLNSWLPTEEFNSMLAQSIRG